MERSFQPGQIAERRPTWLRLLAVMCVLVLGIASTAEVCHTHQSISRASKDSRQNVPGPDHCPLCVAMHTALPATANTTPDPVLQAQPVALRVVTVQRAQQWSYELFSRPPPIASPVV